MEYRNQPRSRLYPASVPLKSVPGKKLEVQKCQNNSNLINKCQLAAAVAEYFECFTLSQYLISFSKFVGKLQVVSILKKVHLYQKAGDSITSFLWRYLAFAQF